MEKLEKNIFYSITHGKINLEKVILEIKKFLEENPNALYSLVIGADSHEKYSDKSGVSINLVTAILVHRKGFGGKY